MLAEGQIDGKSARLPSQPISASTIAEFRGIRRVSQEGSMIRRLASLPRLRSGTVRQLHRYYQGAMTSCRPSRRTSLSSFGGTIRSARVSPPLWPSAAAGRISWSCSPGTSGREMVDGNDRISYVPGEPLLCSCPALRPRQDQWHQANCDALARPPQRPRQRLLHV